MAVERGAGVTTTLGGPGPAVGRLVGTQHERGVELVGRDLLGQEIQ